MVHFKEIDNNKGQAFRFTVSGSHEDTFAHYMTAITYRKVPIIIEKYHVRINTEKIFLLVVNFAIMFKKSISLNGKFLL